jgi:hypothetical protein
VPLPFDFSNTVKEVGWKLQDIIIWRKERTVPWSAKGQSRSIFEYVLLFSKSKKYRYYTDRVRDIQSLKRWWVKYPERYHPKGKNLEEIWNFDIPTQGSWGNGYIKHFCPLPEGLIERIILLTTNPGDVVLDPFVGSGTVPAQAYFQSRKYIGFEINRSYIRMFCRYLEEYGTEKRRHYKRVAEHRVGYQNFRKLILDLRTLKFAKILEREFVKLGYKCIKKIFVERINTPAKQKFSLLVARYVLLVNGRKNTTKTRRLVKDIIMEPPLSKYGIQSRISITSNRNRFARSLRGKSLYCYPKTSTFKYASKVDAEMGNDEFLIISPIKVDIREKDVD